MSEHLHLIDSSVWVRIFRRPPSSNLAGRVDELLARTAAINGVLKVEILSGARNEAEFQDYLETLGSLIQLAIVDETWERTGQLGFALRRRGLTASIPDLVIAASAIEHDAVLLHADADFDRIAAHTALKVESHAGLP